MNTSRYIARLIGPLFLVMGFGMLIEGDTVRALSQEFLSNISLIYLAGMLTLVAGLAIVNAHNLWVANWRIIITILGWLSVIGGVIRLLVPGKVQALGAGMISHPHAMIIGGAVILVLGAILTWTGYELAGDEKPSRKPAPKPKTASAAAKRKPSRAAARPKATKAAAKRKSSRAAAKPKPRRAAAKSRTRAAASRSTAKRKVSRKRARPARKPRTTARKRR
jgi:hypothetical protein